MRFSAKKVLAFVVCVAVVLSTFVGALSVSATDAAVVGSVTLADTTADFSVGTFTTTATVLLDAPKEYVEAYFQLGTLPSGVTFTGATSSDASVVVDTAKRVIALSAASVSSSITATLSFTISGNVGNFTLSTNAVYYADATDDDATLDITDTAAVVIHGPSSNMASDSTGHYYTCVASGCTDKYNLTAHTAAAAVTENNVPASCSATGSYDSVVYCSVCGYEISRTNNTVPMTEHTPAAAVIENEVAANCTTAGSYDSVVYCSVCNAEIIRTNHVVAATGHTPAAAVVENEVAATCGAAGSYDSVVYCSVCNAEISRTQNVIPATGAHSYVYTDNGDGTHTVTCANCSYSSTEEHSYTDGTCVCGATEVVACSHANKEFYYDKTDLTHRYVAATADSTGVIYFRCLDCGEIIEETVQYYLYYATGTTNLNLASEIRAQFYVRNDHLAKQGGNPTDVIVTLKKAVYGNEPNVSVFGLDDAEPATVNGKSANMFSIGVAAKELNDTITANVFAYYNGQWYNGMTIEKSVKTFAMDSITAATTSGNPLTLKKLYANMLVYGAKAQVYFNYKTDDLTDSDLTGYEDLITTADPVIEDHSENPLLVGKDHVGFFAYALSLGAKVEIDARFRTDFYKGGDPLGTFYPTATLEGSSNVWSTEDFSLVSGYTTRYSFYYDGAAAKDMRKLIVMQVVNESGNLGYSLTTSIESVARKLLDANASNINLCNVVKKMMVYGDAAAAYFG